MRPVSATFHNPAATNSECELRSRIFQASSATAVLISENPGKRLQIPADETVLTSTTLNFPAVKAETKFLVQWLENTGRVIGTTRVLVYPTNLLESLQPLLCETNFGVLDPNNQLKPLLKQNGVEFLDLGETALEDFQGRLAIIGPYRSRDQVREGLTQAIRQMAKNGAVVVWMQPPAAPEAKDGIKPSFYVVPEGKGAVMVVQPGLVADLAGNPQSQLNLIWFCQWALNPQPEMLPEWPEP